MIFANLKIPLYLAEIRASCWKYMVKYTVMSYDFKFW